MTKRPGWTRLSEPGRKLDAKWIHDASGWIVRHCGHPTANWPYHATDPAFPERCVVTHNGYGFRTLLDACMAVEAVLRGELVATNEWCLDHVRRLVTPDRIGEDRSGLRLSNAAKRAGYR
jgi:hypothetical protein